MRSLFDYVNACKAAHAAFTAWWRASTEEGFVIATERFLHEAATHLEVQKNHFVKTTEDGLSSVVVCFLNQHGVQASRETNSNGHVDLLVRHEAHPYFRICGEAKIWDGKQYHFDGLEQLLGYMTGRFPHGFVIAYVKKGVITKIFKTLEADLNKELPCEQQGDCKRHSTMDWTLYSHHVHGCGKTVRVLHKGVNMTC